MKKTIAMLFLLVIVFSFTGCSRNKAFNDFEVGNTVQKDSDIKCIKVADRYCLVKGDHRTELFVLEDSVLSVPISELENDFSIPWVYEYDGVISGVFSRAFYGNDEIVFEYLDENGTAKYVSYSFDGAERHYFDSADLVEKAIKSYTRIQLSNESYAEYRYNMYCTGNKDDLNTFLKRLKNVCKNDDEFIGYVNKEYAMYWLRAEGCYRWSLDAKESDSERKNSSKISLDGLVEMSKGLEIDIQIIGYCDMLEMRERARVINGEITTWEKEFFPKSFDFDIFLIH